MTGDSFDLIIAMEPLPFAGAGIPKSTELLVAAARAGALPVVEVGGQDEVAAAVESIARRADGPVALQPASAHVALEDWDAPEAVSTLVLSASVAADLLASGRLGDAIGFRADAGLRVIVEITDAASARSAVAAGASGLIAKGCESGGRVGCTESFILCQQTVGLGVPVWVRGGIGLHTAAAAVALGARGVVLDTQLALVRESRLPEATRTAIAAMDGSETRVIGDHRVFVRPDLPVASRPASAEPSVIAAELGSDIARHLLPIGQDAAFASKLAARFKTAGGVVEAIRSS
ncbi:MAG TPA: nitronate monooxygenase, partial [Acidimicrobiales bacterium]|nr:nitronate monooxygenase [Acidimicrobiales bacterium]